MYNEKKQSRHSGSLLACSFPILEKKEDFSESFLMC